MDNRDVYMFKNGAVNFAKLSKISVELKVLVATLLKLVLSLLRLATLFLTNITFFIKAKLSFILTSKLNPQNWNKPSSNHVKRLVTSLLFSVLCKFLITFFLRFPYGT